MVGSFLYEQPQLSLMLLLLVHTEIKEMNRQTLDSSVNDSFAAFSILISSKVLSFSFVLSLFS